MALGVGGGAAEAMQQILRDRFQQQQQAFAQQQQQAASARADQELGLQRGEAEAREGQVRAQAQRQTQNDAALAQLENDPSLPAPVRTVIHLNRLGVKGINSVADITPKDTAPPKRTLVAIKGPKGEKIEKSLTDEELSQGVQGYEPPKAPPAEKSKIWVTRGGMPTFIDPNAVQPGDAPYQQRGQKTPTGADRQAFAYFNRAKNAISDIEGGESGQDMESQIAKQGVMGQAGTLLLPNALQSQLGQSYRQAQRAFTEARLRKESGAAINDAEYQKDARTYFAQPGDTPQTIHQKRAARQQVLEGLAFASGPAYEEYYGEPFKAHSAGTAHAPAAAPGVKIQSITEIK